ncbi:diphthamide biosynthesis enzyme Dph1/Dph2 domain protein [Babesia bovis T2Bo]|uniref:2-(3-amino-3-carboxypropyl)histidine synthase n=1 Tax=Babesia bovis TaxID=5865 RepID=A7AS77_BABBO|nr:diphthamide biosynthesis enzyme Dph1/Dph2 domain protein [Babesia bovis T2Bo]EDO07396.1 diphthamide biosynthesis enzyme Dph1/Dph2 domain protein [Babesia bovis T2Bo]|eukprot:XP_001610964.1 hypothetical protein [Babesia bovis T2Bo]
MEFNILEPLVDEIKSRGYQRIAIQSSDVSAAVSVCSELHDRCKSLEPNREFYVLGDVFVGSCCTDVIAARRTDADYVIHVGDACQSFVESPVPIRFLFNPVTVDTDILFCVLSDRLSTYNFDRILLVYHSSLHHISGLFVTWLSGYSKPSFIAQCMEHILPDDGVYNHENVFCYRKILRCCSDTALETGYINDLHMGEQDTLVLFLYAGTRNNVTEDHIALKSVGSQFHVMSVDTLEYSIMDSRGHSLRSRRYHKVGKIQDASTIGILVVARTIKGYRELRRAIVRLIESQGKRCYTFSVNCLTEAKLANMPNIDIFCMLSCCESILSLPEEIGRRVVYPFELLVAFDCIDWSLPYEFDFVTLTSYIPESSTDETTSYGGEIRRLQGGCEIQLQVDSFMDTLQDNSKRTFGGVDPLEGITREPKVLPGFHGIASRYDHEVDK